jgi:uncharacterized protein
MNKAAALIAPALSPVPPLRWWQVPMVWLVISGPLSVVLACVVTGYFAWTYIDPVIHDASQTVAPAVSPKAPAAPAMQGRNHAATPER